MSSGIGDQEHEVEKVQQSDDVEEEFVETVVLTETVATDNVGDASVEINVEQLIADIEGSDEEVSAHKKEVRRRLEELAEEQSFEDTYAIDFDKND